MRAGTDAAVQSGAAELFWRPGLIFVFLDFPALCQIYAAVAQ